MPSLAALQHCDSSFKMPAASLLSRRSVAKTDQLKSRPRKSRDLRLSAPVPFCSGSHIFLYTLRSSTGVMLAPDYIIRIKGYCGVLKSLPVRSKDRWRLGYSIFSTINYIFCNNFTNILYFFVFRLFYPVDLD